MLRALPLPALLLLAPAAAGAGTVYVPLSGRSAAGGVAYEAEVTVVNIGDGAALREPVPDSDRHRRDVALRPGE